MTLIESVTFHEESTIQVVDCMVCGSAVVVNGDSAFRCQECGSDFEVVSRFPLSIHFPAQDCGE